MTSTYTRSAPWWTGTPCPGCMPGCTASHSHYGREEWDDGGAHFCRRTLTENDDVVVELTRWAGVGVEPGSEVTIHPVQVYWHIQRGDAMDMSATDARRIVGRLWALVLEAGEIADKLNAEARALTDLTTPTLSPSTL